MLGCMRGKVNRDWGRCGATAKVLNALKAILRRNAVFLSHSPPLYKLNTRCTFDVHSRSIVHTECSGSLSLASLSSGDSIVRVSTSDSLALFTSPLFPLGVTKFDAPHLLKVSRLGHKRPDGATQTFCGDSPFGQYAELRNRSANGLKTGLVGCSGGLVPCPGGRLKPNPRNESRAIAISSRSFSGAGCVTEKILRTGQV